MAISEKVQRKLTTILAADAVGYSHAMNTDEVRALSALRASRRVFSKFIERHDGRIVNTAGDGLIAEFSSVVEAVQCAIEVQQELDSCVESDALRFRIGIHLGDVMVDGSDLLGEGVNLAARLESMAEPGGVLISRQVYDQVQHKLSLGFEYLGEKRPKNFVDDVAIYRVSMGKKQRRAQQFKEPASSAPNRDNDNLPTIDLKKSTAHNGRRLGIVWLFLLGIDIATGTPFWAHWPGLAMGGYLALQAAPLFTKDRFELFTARAVVIVCLLALVNIFTWTGYPWVLWPAAVFTLIALLRKVGVRS